MRREEPIKIGVSGVRGIVGRTMTPQLAVHLARAFATLCGQGRVAVASDTRSSGPLLREAVLAGLQYSGLVPCDLGVVPTPTLQLVVRQLGMAGGIMITASHNPVEWNGLKFVGSNGLFLSPFRSAHLMDTYHQRSFLEPPAGVFPEVEHLQDAFALHRERVFSVIDPGPIRAGRFRVLVDPGGGAGIRVDRAYLESLGCQVTQIHGEAVSAAFPRPPEPLAPHLEAASQRMKGGGFDVGFAQDADADRLVLLDELGQAVPEDQGLALALMSWLQGKAPGTVVVNLSTSRMVDEVASSLGHRVERSPVGEINVVEHLLAVQGLIGGEGNGGVILPLVHPCRDSFAGMALILSLMARTAQPLSRLLQSIPAWKMIKLKIPVPTLLGRRLVNRWRERYPQGDLRDGLRVDYPGYWFHLRASNTEPVIRLIVEGLPSDVEVPAQRLREQVESEVAEMAQNSGAV